MGFLKIRRGRGFLVATLFYLSDLTTTHHTPILKCMTFKILILILHHHRWPRAAPSVFISHNVDCFTHYVIYHRLSVRDILLADRKAIRYTFIISTRTSIDDDCFIQTTFCCSSALQPLVSVLLYLTFENLTHEALIASESLSCGSETQISIPYYSSSRVI